MGHVKILLILFTHPNRRNDSELYTNAPSTNEHHGRKSAQMHEPKPGVQLRLSHSHHIPTFGLPSWSTNQNATNKLDVRFLGNFHKISTNAALIYRPRARYKSFIKQHEIGFVIWISTENFNWLSLNNCPIQPRQEITHPSTQYLDHFAAGLKKPFSNTCPKGPITHFLGTTELTLVRGFFCSYTIHKTFNFGEDFVLSIYKTWVGGKIILDYSFSVSTIIFKLEGRGHTMNVQFSSSKPNNKKISW